MKHFVLILSTLFLAVAPAWADKPLHTSGQDGPFADIDPCTGQAHDVTLYWDAYWHFHQNNLVLKLTRTGETSSGYTMTSSAETYVENHNATIVKDHWVDTWHADDDRVFQAFGVFLADWETGQVRVDVWEYFCRNS